ncbi:hypothetical protein [Geotalea sp. SG265]|uniref:hypothetical protein n=1 Tax=Geotalea sp. SG265 TaxID=2922867 RepID=UPI001FAECBC4|nr:hypothetical protein [Geotalea sp. SG265]
MNKQKILKSLGYVVGGICLLGLGFILGYREGVVAGGFSASMAELQLSRDGMSLQMNEGSCDTVKKTIKAHFVLMDKYKGKNELIMPNHTYNADKFLGYLRLFLVERHEGNSIEADKQLKAAASACKQAEMKDCSEASILRMADNMKVRQPMACLSSQK